MSQLTESLVQDLSVAYSTLAILMQAADDLADNKGLAAVTS